MIEESIARNKLRRLGHHNDIGLDMSDDRGQQALQQQNEGELYENSNQLMIGLDDNQTYANNNNIMDNTSKVTNDLNLPNEAMETCTRDPSSNNDRSSEKSSR